MDVNKVLLVGTVMGDVMVRGNGKVTAFPLSTSEKVTGGDGQSQYINTWHDCVAFGKLAEACANLQKWDRVWMEGSLSKDSYEKDGQKIYKTQIKVQKLVTVGRQKQADGGQAPAQQPAQQESEDGPYPW